jgi:hypothetical protein
VRLLLAPYPFEREAALTAAAAWFISAWFYWNIATAVFRRAGLTSAARYTLEAGLFPLRMGFVFIAAAFLLLTYLFFQDRPGDAPGERRSRATQPRSPWRFR